jgi:hypothetical protein
MKKLQPIFIAFEKILGGIFRAFEPVLDVFIELAMEALPYITKGIGMFYSGLFSLFTLVKEVGTGVFKILQGIATLDFKKAGEGLRQVAGSFSKTADSYNASVKRFEKGTKELTQTEKENEEERKKLADEARAKREKAAADELARRKADLDAKIQLETDKETTSTQKLKSLLQQRYQLELQGQKLTNAQKELLRKENEKKVDEALKADQEKRQADFNLQLKQLQDNNKLILDQLTIDLDKKKILYGEESIEVRKVQDDIYKAQEEALKRERDLLASKKILTDEEKARIISIGIEEQSLTNVKDLETKRRLKIDTDAFVKAAQERKTADDAAYQAKMLAASTDFELQQQILDAKIEQDKLYYQKLLQNENLTAEQRKQIQDAQTANVEANAKTQIDIEQKKFQAQQLLLGATANAITALADIIGKNTVAGKALAVAASLINTYAAIAAQLKTAAGSPGGAIPGYAIAQAVATGLVGFKAVADIIKTPVPTSNSGGASSSSDLNSGPSVPRPRGLATGGFVTGPGTSTSDSIPTMLSNGESVINAASTAMFKPLLSTINQMGGGAKFDGGIIGTSSSVGITEMMPPIKTYVVANDMTNQQEFERMQKSRANI